MPSEGPDPEVLPPEEERPQTEKEYRQQGRRPKQINKGDFESLCSYHMTLNEVSSFFKVQPDTLQRWCVNTYGQTFGKVYIELSSFGKLSLKRKMWTKALDGDNMMLIWLSKNMLGFSNEPRESDAEKNPAVVNIIWQDAQPQIPKDAFYDKPQVDEEAPEVLPAEEFED